MCMGHRAILMMVEKWHCNIDDGWEMTPCISDEKWTAEDRCGRWTLIQPTFRCSVSTKMYHIVQQNMFEKLPVENFSHSTELQMSVGLQMTLHARIRQNKGFSLMRQSSICWQLTGRQNRLSVTIRCQRGRNIKINLATVLSYCITMCQDTVCVCVCVQVEAASSTSVSVWLHKFTANLFYSKVV